MQTYLVDNLDSEEIIASLAEGGDLTHYDAMTSGINYLRDRS